MKRVVVLIIACILLLSIVGCAPKQAQTTSPNEQSGATKADGGKEKQALIPLTVELFDRSNIPASEGTIEDNRWTQYAKEEMLKLGVELTFVTVPRWEENEKLNTLMAAGSAPDLIFTYNRLLFAQYAFDGGLNDLGPGIEQWGEKIQEYLGGAGILDYGIVDGKQYAIPAQRQNPNHRTAMIRTDWLEIVGKETPTTKEELVDVLKAFRDAPAGAFGVDTVIPWGGTQSTVGDLQPHSFQGTNSMYSFMHNDREEMITTPIPLREGFKEYMAFMNMMWKEDLLDPEFATDTGELLGQKITNGQVGFFPCDWWAPPKDMYGLEYTTLREAIPTAELDVVEPFENVYDGAHYKTQLPPVGLYLMCPATAKSTEGVIKYLNWQLSQDASMMLKFGVEGEHYAYNEQGAPMPIDPEYNATTFDYLKQDLCLVWNGFPASLPQETLDALFESEYTSQENTKLAVAANKAAGTDPIPEVLFNAQIKAEEDFMPQLSATYDEYWVKLIQADDFDAVYTEFIDKIKSQGIDEIAAERAEYYKTLN